MSPHKERLCRGSLTCSFLKIRPTICGASRPVGASIKELSEGNMRQRTTLHVGVLAFLLSFALGEVSAQDSLKQQLVGTWTLVSSTGKQPDGSSTWGDNPKSLLIFTADGRFSQAIMRADRKKFSANSRYQGTPEEN